LANQYDPQDENDEPQKNAGEIFLEEVSKTPEKRSRTWWTQVAFIPLLAVFTGLVFGAIFIIFTTRLMSMTLSANRLGRAFRSPGKPFRSPTPRCSTGLLAILPR
jgi:hypothetical protein